MIETVLEKDGAPLAVRVGAKVFKLYHGEDGTLYVEGQKAEAGVRVVVSDEDGSAPPVDGLWVNIDFTPLEES